MQMSCHVLEESINAFEFQSTALSIFLIKCINNKNLSSYEKKYLVCTSIVRWGQIYGKLASANKQTNKPFKIYQPSFTDVLEELEEDETDTDLLDENSGRDAETRLLMAVDRLKDLR